MARGFKVLMLLFVIGLTISMLGGLGVFAELGFQVSPGIQGDVDAVAGEVGSDGGIGGQGGTGFVAFVTGIWNSFRVGWALIFQTSTVLQSLFGVPPDIANNIELLARVAFFVFGGSVLIRYKISQ